MILQGGCGGKGVDRKEGGYSLAVLLIEVGAFDEVITCFFPIIEAVK